MVDPRGPLAELAAGLIEPTVVFKIMDSDLKAISR
jgi:hypothetical protein